MDFGNRNDRIVAAGEYVLGVLAPEEQTQVERALAGSAELRDELRWWEQRFAGLGLRLAPVAPRPVVWLDLLQRTKSRSAPLRGPSPSRPTGVTAWAWIATAASVLLAVGLVREMGKAPQVVERVVERPVEVPAPGYVALLKVPDSTMNWTISVTPASRQMVVRASGDAPAAAKDLDAELWVITDAGPLSLGVIPKTGEMRRPIPDPGVIGSGKTLAVSLEPPGGSPTGKPTGPVVSTGTVLQAG